MHSTSFLPRGSQPRFYEAVSFSEAMKSQTPEAGKAYLGAYADADGEWLDGGKNYTLHIPLGNSEGHRE
jgi:hypothetical protein